MERSSLRSFALTAALAAAGVAFVGAPSEARADGSVSPKGKGIVGGALLGGEIVTMPMGIAGLKPWWPYLVFGGLGSVGGAIGGWGVEKATSGTTDASGKTTGQTAEPALYMLAGGLALLIPTLVVSLNATTKSQYKDDSNTEPSAQPPAPGVPGAPGTAPAQPDGTSVTVTKTSSLKRHPHERRPYQIGLVGLDREGLMLGVPAVQIKPMYTPVELSQYGIEQKTEVHIPVFSAAF
jgi:hypothetical protein